MLGAHLENRDTNRLKNYTEMLGVAHGGLEFLLELAKQRPQQPSGFERIAPNPARAAIESIETDHELRPPEYYGLEALIAEEIRPAFEIVNGSFRAPHPLWSKLATDPTLKKRIESVIPSVGRIELPGNTRYPYGGTGFVVGNNLIMTNRHVAEIFATGLGNRNLNFISGAKAGIDFLREKGDRTGKMLEVRNILMIHPYWDMSILEVEGLSAEHASIKLSLADAREMQRGHEIFVVGYPAYDPRNPDDAQRKLFQGVYGIKRLQPGALQGVEETASFGKMVRAAAHDCSTLGGNSGSAVFDLTNGEVLALHFGGQYHEKNFAVPSFEMARDSRVINAGATFSGVPPGDPNDWPDWWRLADSKAPDQGTKDNSAAMRASDQVSPSQDGIAQDSMSVNAIGSVAGAADGGSVVPGTGLVFDPTAAMLYGRFVQAAYTMYDANPSNLTPPQSSDFPAEYRLIAWIHMRDFTIGSTGPIFYGFIARSVRDPNQFVLAIRGTSNGIEWWDDVNATTRVPFKVPNCGAVGMGFARIYDTLEVIDVPSSVSPAATESLRATGGFSQQVSELVRHRANVTPKAEGLEAPTSIEVTGHSLGAALATLYVMENAQTDKISNPALCTFASPLVGDSTFADAFNAVQVTSWRVVNQQDIVPKLPPEILGFRHVEREQRFSSTGKVRSSFSCWHALTTYLNLIDPSVLPSVGCQLGAPSAAAETIAAASAPGGTVSSAAAKSFSVPAGPVTVNITINVERSD